MKIIVASDATGTTAQRVLQAALTQFDHPSVEILRHGRVRSPEQVRAIMEEAAREGGFVVHTLVSQSLRDLVLSLGRSLNVGTIDLMGPLLARLAELLDVPPRAEPGLYTPFDSASAQRIEAMDFAVRHDDGRHHEELAEAEIVLVGVSRTSKTPLSIFLAYRGWKVANVPLVLGLEPPPELFLVPSRRVVGLVADPERLAALRQYRVRQSKAPLSGYAELGHVRREMQYAFEVFQRARRWSILDVTTKTIEEAAAEIVSLLRQTGGIARPPFGETE